MKCLSRTEPTYALKAFNYVQYMVVCLLCFFIQQLILFYSSPLANQRVTAAHSTVNTRI